MPCDLTVIDSDVSLNCEDIPVGGLVSIYVARFGDVSGVVQADMIVTDLTIADGKVINLEFNKKDGVTNFTETKTVDQSGVTTNVPTLVAQFPKMTLSKRNALEKLTSNGEFIVFTEDATGTMRAIGLDVGVWGSAVDGQSGAGRADINSYTLTFTGEETNLSSTVDATAWGKIVAALKPII